MIVHTSRNDVYRLVVSPSLRLVELYASPTHDRGDHLYIAVTSMNLYGSDMSSRIESTHASVKKKLDVFIGDDATEGEWKRRGSDRDRGTAGHAFFGHARPFDCSIGNIFGDFVKPGSFKIHSISPRRSRQALSVLIVDDSIIHRKITMKALGGLIDEVMWVCDSAENGETAIQLVRNSIKVPDVIIIDQDMESTGGRMLGHQVVELLRQDTDFDNVVIIGCTGMSELAQRDLLGAGCDAVWSKPMPSRDEAQGQIVRFLSQKHHQRIEKTLRENITRAIRPHSSSYTRNETSAPLPVFEQVKVAGVAYTPLPWSVVTECAIDWQLQEAASSRREDEEVACVQRELDTVVLSQSRQEGEEEGGRG